MTAKKEMLTKIVVGIPLVAIICVGGYIVHLHGANTKSSAADTPPVADTISSESSVVENLENGSFVVENAPTVDENKVDKAEFVQICENAYNSVWKVPRVLLSSPDHLQMELEWLSFYLEEASITYTDTEKEAYISWREQNHADPQPDFEFQPATPKVVCEGGLTAFNKPCIYDGALMGTFSSGTVLDIVDVTPCGTWARIQTPDGTVYVLAKELKDYKVGQQPVSNFVDTYETVYATHNVNIRAEYNVNSDKVGLLVAGNSILRIGVGQGEATGWSKVIMKNGNIAFIKSDFLSTVKQSTENKSPDTSGGTGPNPNSSGIKYEMPSENSGTTTTVTGNNNYTKPSSPSTNNGNGVPDLSALGPEADMDWEIIDESNMSVGDLDDTGLKINP